MKEQYLGKHEQRIMQREAFFSLIPKDAKSLYVHLSHRIESKHPYIIGLQDKYGADNILVTTAPSTLEQSSNEKEKEQIIKPFERFSANKSIDAVIYLCNYVCDGYPRAYYPADRENPIDFETSQHIWRPIGLAQQLKKPLIVGHQNDFCFKYKCCNELMYILDLESKRPPVKITEITCVY